MEWTETSRRRWQLSGGPKEIGEGGTSLSGEYITGRAAARLEILPPPEDMWQFLRYGDSVDSQYGEARNAGDHPEMHLPTPHPTTKLTNQPQTSVA